MSVVIVEGPDGAGKTTLIEALRKEWRWSGVDHHGAYLGEARIAQHYLKSLYRAKLQPRRAQFMDRSWLAEPIYGAVMRGGANRVLPFERRMLERVALGVGATVVLCLPPYARCRAAWEARLEREYPRKAEQLEQLYRGYEKLRDSVALVYDYTRCDTEVFTNVIRSELGNNENYGPGIGNWGASTLLIGDRVNETNGHRGLPFVSFNRTGCSAWLADQLEGWGVPETELYWANQAEVDVDVLCPDRFKRVIALGGYATEWCERHGLPHTSVPHPQFWKRFHYNEPYPLKEALT